MNREEFAIIQVTEILVSWTSHFMHGYLKLDQDPIGTYKTTNKHMLSKSRIVPQYKLYTTNLFR